MVLRRIGLRSSARVAAIVYAMFGLVVGAFLSLSTLVVLISGGAAPDSSGVALASVVFMPAFYGVIGLILGLLGAALYNWTAKLVGGIEIDVG